MNELTRRAPEIRDRASKCETVLDLARSKMTPREEQCLRFVVKYLRKSGGVSPAYTEIMAALDLRSKTQVYRLMHSLEARGYVRLGRGIKRAIEVIGNEHIPIYRASDNKLMGWLP